MNDGSLTTAEAKECADTLAAALRIVIRNDPNADRMTNAGMIIAVTSCVLHVENCSEEGLRKIEEGQALISAMIEEVRKQRAKAGA